MEVWIGTSGYSYTDWIGGFYPAGIRPARMLEHYATCFPLVELNFTFYRMPEAGDLDRLADRVPRQFQFVVKLHQSISHDLQLEQAIGFRDALRGLQERGQLSGVLCQFPQRFHDDPQHRSWIAELSQVFAGQGLAVEFRHRSWARAEIPRWLASLGVHLVSVDVPDIPALYPRGLVWSTGLAYVRLHSRRASAWYLSDKERYDYDYSDAELSEWIGWLQSAEGAIARAWVLFNNCYRAHAAANARRFAELLERLVPGFQVVRPFAGPARSQPTLFP
jgi:uncharacterized protein YecE (DUF72 family)